jgi:outer membrane biosynthesis protein TonB
MVVGLWANIGKILIVKGEANVQRGDKDIPAKMGLKLNNKDTITTQDRTKLQIEFKDGTVIRIGKNSKFAIEEYLYDKSKNSKATFKVNRGIFKTFTGKIGKVARQNFKLKTRTATCGIRGTIFGGLIDPVEEVLIVEDGGISLTTDAGSVNINKGEFSMIVNGGAPAAPQETTQAVLNKVKKGSKRNQQAAKQEKQEQQKRKEKAAPAKKQSQAPAKKSQQAAPAAKKQGSAPAQKAAPAAKANSKATAPTQKAAASDGGDKEAAPAETTDGGDDNAAAPAESADGGDGGDADTAPAEGGADADQPQALQANEGMLADGAGDTAVETEVAVDTEVEVEVEVEAVEVEVEIPEIDVAEIAQDEAAAEVEEVIEEVVEDPVTEDPIEEPVTEDPIEEPTEDPVTEDPVEEPVTEDPVEEPVVEDPVDETPVVNTGSSNTTTTTPTDNKYTSSFTTLADNTWIASGTKTIAKFYGNPTGTYSIDTGTTTNDISSDISQSYTRYYDKNGAVYYTIRRFDIAAGTSNIEYAIYESSAITTMMATSYFDGSNTTYGMGGSLRIGSETIESDNSMVGESSVTFDDPATIMADLAYTYTTNGSTTLEPYKVSNSTMFDWGLWSDTDITGVSDFSSLASTVKLDGAWIEPTSFTAITDPSTLSSYSNVVYYSGNVLGTITTPMYSLEVSNKDIIDGFYRATFDFSASTFSSKMFIKSLLGSANAEIDFGGTITDASSSFSVTSASAISGNISGVLGGSTSGNGLFFGAGAEFIAGGFSFITTDGYIVDTVLGGDDLTKVDISTFTPTINNTINNPNASGITWGFVLKDISDLASVPMTQWRNKYYSCGAFEEVMTNIVQEEIPDSVDENGDPVAGSPAIALNLSSNIFNNKFNYVSDIDGDIFINTWIDETTIPGTLQESQDTSGAAKIAPTWFGDGTRRVGLYYSPYMIGSNNFSNTNIYAISTESGDVYKKIDYTLGNIYTKMYIKMFQSDGSTYDTAYVSIDSNDTEQNVRYVSDSSVTASVASDSLVWYGANVLDSTLGDQASEESSSSIIETIKLAWDDGTTTSKISATSYFTKISDNYTYKDFILAPKAIGTDTDSEWSWGYWVNSLADSNSMIANYDTGAGTEEVDYNEPWILPTNAVPTADSVIDTSLPTALFTAKIFGGELSNSDDMLRIVRYGNAANNLILEFDFVNATVSGNMGYELEDFINSGSNTGSREYDIDGTFVSNSNGFSLKVVDTTDSTIEYGYGEGLFFGKPENASDTTSSTMEYVAGGMTVYDTDNTVTHLAFHSDGQFQTFFEMSSFLPVYTTSSPISYGYHLNSTIVDQSDSNVDVYMINPYSGVSDGVLNTSTTIYDLANLDVTYFNDENSDGYFDTYINIPSDYVQQSDLSIWTNKTSSPASDVKENWDRTIGTIYQAEYYGHILGSAKFTVSGSDVTDILGTNILTTGNITDNGIRVLLDYRRDILETNYNFVFSNSITSPSTSGIYQLQAFHEDSITSYNPTSAVMGYKMEDTTNTTSFDSTNSSNFTIVSNNGSLYGYNGEYLIGDVEVSLQNQTQANTGFTDLGIAGTYILAKEFEYQKSSGTTQTPISGFDRFSWGYWDVNYMTLQDGTSVSSTDVPHIGAWVDTSDNGTFPVTPIDITSLYMYNSMDTMTASYSGAILGGTVMDIENKLSYDIIEADLGNSIGEFTLDINLMSSTITSGSLNFKVVDINLDDTATWSATINGGYVSPEGFELHDISGSVVYDTATDNNTDINDGNGSGIFTGKYGHNILGGIEIFSDNAQDADLVFGAMATAPMYFTDSIANNYKWGYWDSSLYSDDFAGYISSFDTATTYTTSVVAGDSWLVSDSNSMVSSDIGSLSSVGIFNGFVFGKAGGSDAANLVANGFFSMTVDFVNSFVYGNMVFSEKDSTNNTSDVWNINFTNYANAITSDASGNSIALGTISGTMNSSGSVTAISAADNTATVLGSGGVDGLIGKVGVTNGSDVAYAVLASHNYDMVSRSIGTSIGTNDIFDTYTDPITSGSEILYVNYNDIAMTADTVVAQYDAYTSPASAIGTYSGGLYGVVHDGSNEYSIAGSFNMNLDFTSSAVSATLSFNEIVSNTVARTWSASISNASALAGDTNYIDFGTFTGSVSDSTTFSGVGGAYLLGDNGARVAGTMVLDNTAGGRAAKVALAGSGEITIDENISDTGDANYEFDTYFNWGYWSNDYTADTSSGTKMLKNGVWIGLESGHSVVDGTIDTNDNGVIDEIMTNVSGYLTSDNIANYQGNVIGTTADGGFSGSIDMSIDFDDSAVSGNISFTDSATTPQNWSADFANSGTALSPNGDIDMGTFTTGTGSDVAIDSSSTGHGVFVDTGMAVMGEFDLNPGTSPATGVYGATIQTP